MIQTLQRLNDGPLGELLRKIPSLPGRIAGRVAGGAAAPPGLAESIRRLCSARDRMARGSAELEKNFLQIIEALDAQGRMSESLVAQSEKLLGYVTGSVGGDVELQKAIDLLGQPLGFVRSGHERTSRLIERLKHHQSQLENVGRHEAVLNGTVAPLKFIQTLFRVESATLPAEVQGIFTGLTKDIENLQTRVTDIFGEQFQSLASARFTIRELIGRLAEQTARQERVSREKQELIGSSLEALRADMRENQNRDVRLTRTSRSVHETIGRIVTGMQFQDITRQKTEHVLAAVAEMDERFSAMRGGSGRAASAEHLRFLREAARLQIGQLESIRADLAGAEAQIRASFDRLAADATEIDQECVNLGTFKSVSAAEDGMVQSLLNIVAELRLLIAGTVAVQQEAYETIKPLGGLASNLTGVLRQLSVNIKLIAINAQIQAAHVGQGTGLEVLSERTSAISDEIYRLNEKVGIDLDGMVAGLEEVVAEFRSLSDTGQEQRRLLAEEGAQEELRLHAYRDATLQCFISVGSSAGELEQSIRATLASVRFGALADQMIDPLLDALRDVLRAVEDSGVAARHPDDQRLTRHLTANYTMASERAVHAAVEHREPPPRAVAAQAGNADRVPPRSTRPPAEAPAPRTPAPPKADDLAGIDFF